MQDPSGATPFLQVVHISDLHFVHPTYRDPSVWAKLRSLARCVAAWWPEASETIDRGVAGHDELALDPFVEFLKDITANDRTWQYYPTWIVDTGDLTTFGDDDSLQQGQAFLDRLRRETGAELHSMHGNHDAWPNVIPLLAPPAAIKSHRANLRSTHYPQRWPGKPLRCDIPGASGGQVQLFGLNSVVHDRIQNTLALGDVKEDRFWESGFPSANPGVQLQKLEDKIRAAQSTGAGERDFRLVALHHPVCYPPAIRPNGVAPQMVLQNERDVAASLSSPLVKGGGPRAHLILGGHTHELFPPDGTLRPWLRQLAHAPLGRDQAQFVVGSLMQMAPPSGKAPPGPQQAQVLRFFTAPNAPHPGLLVTRSFVRRMAVRGSSLGPYAPTRKANGKTYEAVWCTR